MDKKQPTPSLDLYAEVRAGFVRKHTTLSQWCRANGVFRENARDALKGVWVGPKARQLIERLVQASQPT